MLLDTGWEAARGAEPSEWVPARVPGTAAAAFGPDAADFDAEDWWFRTRFGAEPGEATLRFGGIATVAEVLLNGEPILESESMFVAHAVRVTVREVNELVIRCRPLRPLLDVPRRPRARWRTQLAEGNLRFFRTTLLGRAPGFAPGPAPVGPWRPVTLERHPQPAAARIRVELDGEDGVIHADGEIVCEGRSGEGELRLPGVERWWPHTHGEPRLYEVRVGDTVRRVGFRALQPGPDYDVDADALALRVNGVPVFARGALWTPVDFVSLAPSGEQLRAALEQVRDAGMNMLRLPGTGVYESDAFHDLCDELGILVWQDFMFANFDYPVADDGFRALVEQEARQLLERVAWRPSLAVLCGNSEVEQQAAMLGLDPALGRGALFGELLPRLAREAEAEVPYLPSAPAGGELPFRFDVGVANYFGVGGYRRPLADARLAEVRFAAECLAFANLPDEPPYEPVPGDFGADWDFADVRAHYLQLLYGPDAGEEAARAVTGEVMAEVFGEWRRAGSPCAGALVLWLRDLLPGSGWGLVDRLGRPKAALGHLAPVLQPVAVWTTDEGLAGIDVHVANDRPEPLRARLRIDLYRDFELRVDGAEEAVEVEPHGLLRRNVEGVLGRFVDASYAYRFGPPAHDLVVAILDRDGAVLSQALRFPVARPVPRTDLGLEAERRGGELRVRSRALAYGVRVGGVRAGDDCFFVPPGGERVVPVEPGAGWLTAVNLAGRVEFA
jgi:beta-mannosidase